MEPDDPAVQELRRLAMAAAAHAYCPYSRFPVGAAVLVEGGATFAGCNVENASFGLTICAERSAICQAVAAGHRRLLAIAIYTPTGSPTPPCGACRQVLVEFGPDAEVFCFGRAGPPRRFRLADLLPAAFGPGSLEASVS